MESKNLLAEIQHIQIVYFQVTLEFGFPTKISIKFRYHFYVYRNPRCAIANAISMDIGHSCRLLSVFLHPHTFQLRSFSNS